MDAAQLETILQYVGPGPLAGIIIVAWLWLPWYRRQVKVQEKELILRRCQVRMLHAVAKWLKGEGHEITVPDLTEEI